MSDKPDVGHCPRCSTAFDYRLYHSGFSDAAYAYCDRCGMTALLDGWNSDIPSNAGLQLHERIGPSVEPFLAPCSCGGRFLARAVPRCPTCSDALDPHAVRTFLEANAPGTAKGWRWQGSWDGLYFIVVNDRLVRDPWMPKGSIDRAEA